MRRLVLGAAGLAVAIAVAGTTYAVAAMKTQKAPAVAAAPGHFAHPGVFVSRAQLDFVRGKVQAGAQPWKARLRPDDGQPVRVAVADPEAPRDRRVRLLLQPQQRLHRRARGRHRRVHDVAGLVHHPGQPVRHEGDRRSWTPGRRRSRTTPTATRRCRPAGPGRPGRAPPRSSGTPTPVWPNSGRFATMLRNVYLPEVINGSNSNGNWELSMMEAADRHLRVPGGPDRYDKAMAQVPRPRARLRLPQPPTARCPRPCRAAASTPAPRSSATGRGRPPSSTA